MNKTTEALKLAEKALNAMLTHMGMDEDEWTKPTFDQSRKTLAAIREALADHSGDDNEMVADTNPLSVFAKECSLGAYTPDEMVDAARLALRRAKGLAEPVKQEPVVCQDSDDRRLLREIFMLCEATEEIEATNDFMRGRVFEAKGIRRGIGTWYQDTFCGRSYMGEPVIPAAPVQPVKQEPVAIVDEIGLCVDGTHIFNAIGKVEVGQPLYAAPVSVEAIRAEALEEAEEIAKTIGGSFSVEFLAAIRGLK